MKAEEFKDFLEKLNVLTIVWGKKGANVSIDNKIADSYFTCARELQSELDAFLDKIDDEQFEKNVSEELDKEWDMPTF